MHKAITKVLVFVLPFCFFTPLFAQSDKDLEKAIILYKDENFDEALPILQKARQEDPNSSLAAYYLGITYKQIQDYRSAKQNLIDAVSLKPKIKEALGELIDVLYQLGDLKEADKYLDIAEKESIYPAQTAYLKGLVLLKEDKNKEAVESFQSAENLDPSLAKNCNYQIGLANIKQKNFDAAKKVFRDIIILDPNSDLAQLSNEYINALDRKQKAERPWRAELNVAGQYDTNVILKPSDDAVAAGISNEADWREVVNFLGEYKPKLTERLVLDSQYTMYFAHQNQIGAFDVLSHTINVTPTYYFDKATLGINSGYNYTEVGREKYLTTISESPIVNYIVGKNHLFQANFKYYKNNFAQAPIIPAEDRDSNDYGGGLNYYFFYAENKGFLGLGYNINKDITKGSDWEYLGNSFTGTVLFPFLKKFKASVSGNAFYQNYDNTHVVFGNKRNDKVYTVSSMLAYDFWKEAELQFTYTYVQDNCNIAVYDYNRSIYSMGVDYKF